MSISSENNEQSTVRLLRQCVPGNLSPALFEAVGRLAVYPAIEFIPLRKKDGEVEVLLFERPANDIIWPSMLHTPGTVLRPTDVSFEDAFKRLCRDELMGLATEPPVFIGNQLSINSRGRCLLLEHLVAVTGNPKSGEFYRVDKLPKNFITEQKSSLDRAVAVFTKQ